jgi:hypothetical protein
VDPVENLANSVVFILGVRGNVANTVSLVQSNAPGPASIADVATCRVEHHATAFLAVYVAPSLSNVVINVRQSAGRFVQARTSASNVAHQSYEKRLWSSWSSRVMKRSTWT